MMTREIFQLVPLEKYEHTYSLLCKDPEKSNNHTYTTCLLVN